MVSRTLIDKAYLIRFSDVCPAQAIRYDPLRLTFSRCNEIDRGYFVIYANHESMNSPRLIYYRLHRALSFSTFLMAFCARIYPTVLSHYNSLFRHNLVEFLVLKPILYDKILFIGITVNQLYNSSTQTSGCFKSPYASFQSFLSQQLFHLKVLVHDGQCCLLDNFGSA